MVPIHAYPPAAATSAKRVLLGSARHPVPIHPDPYTNALHGYAASAASAAAGAGSASAAAGARSQVVYIVHHLSLSALHEFPYIGQPDFDCGRMCAVLPIAGLPGQHSGVCTGQRSGVCSQLGRHPSCEFGIYPSTFIPAAPLPRACVTAQISVSNRE
jgi:hypothetical protein